VWNALRFVNYSVEQKDTVNIFLLGKGVELNSLDCKQFNVKEQTDIYMKSGGKILACGTCLQSRNISNPKVCSISSMSDLYDMIKKSKIVLTF
jgi:sulfur relay (sulfurtransferase) complex TusBCD TusD component (DsrE family)